MANKINEQIIDGINYFEILNSINVNDKVEKKNGLSYLSWAYAWAEVKKKFPDSTFTIYENSQGWNYHTDGRTCWVKTGVTVNGIEHIEELPVMDYKNKSIPLENVTSFEVNKTIQRSLTKAVARHGLGLYIYAGEDLPDEQDGTQTVRKASPKPTPKMAAEVPFEVTDSRTELRNFINENHLDSRAIAQACGLNPKSTEQDFAQALEYARGLVK